MGKIESKLKQMGLELPDTPSAVAQYVPAKLVGNLVYCSGQGPIKDGLFLHQGQVGGELMLEEGYECARLCALNCLAAAKSVIGELDRIAEVVHVRGFVNSAPGFQAQPEVVDGASELLVRLLGDSGRHARAAVGVSALPRNIPVELEMVLRVQD